jgi:pimeloyl-ACP methyl ester carboxylesterase
MPHPYDAKKPTLILVNSFTTDSNLYTAQYENKSLTDTMNLLAIELLGHGGTRTKSENFTYWDTAIMNLQVMDALGIPKAFVLGTSQGGWITVRMALLGPDKVRLFPSRPVSSSGEIGMAVVGRLLTSILVDPRHHPARDLAGLRIRPHALAGLLGLPHGINPVHQQVDVQDADAGLRAGGCILQLPCRYRVRQGLRQERKGVLGEGDQEELSRG